MWQHRRQFEPTLVFRYAAEAASAVIYALPHNQFLMHKDPEAGFAFVDLAGGYDALDLRRQISAVDPAGSRQQRKNAHHR